MRRTRLRQPGNRLFLVFRRKSPPRLLCHLVPPGRYSIYRLVRDPGATSVTAKSLPFIPRDEDNPWVIAGRLPGSHLTDLQRPWRRIRKQADLEGVRIHDLRHSFASRALALGESLTMIGKLLGHTQVQTTARYAHLARDSIQTAAARITGSIGENLLGDHDVGSPLVED